MIRLVALGECMLEVQAQGFGAAQFAYGGDTFNTAVYLRRCAADHQIEVHYATAVGDDTLSEALMQAWAAEGLRLDAVQRLPGYLPGLYLIETDPDGERRFHFWRQQSAARRYFAQAIPTPLEAMASQWDCLYLSGISLAILDEPSRARLWALMRALRERGARVVFDNNYRPRLWADAAQARRTFEQAYALADTALITLEDHVAVHGAASAEQALAELGAMNVREVVVKRGALPTLVRSQRGQAWAEVPTYAVNHVVDTTAAGDSFAGAYLSRRLLGVQADEAAAWGNRVASVVIQHRGAIIPAAVMPRAT